METVCRMNSVNLQYSLVLFPTQGVILQPSTVGDVVLVLVQMVVAPLQVGSQSIDLVGERKGGYCCGGLVGDP